MVAAEAGRHRPEVWGAWQCQGDGNRDGILTEMLEWPPMVSAFADEAVRVHRSAHLPDTLIAEAVGAKASTVRDWLAARSSPTGPRARRLAELAEITDRLARLVDPRYIPVWMVKPVEALDDHTPLELIASGHARRVARLVSELESPGAA